MKRINTLRKNWQFQEIIESKKQIVSQTLIVYHRKNTDKLKVGISISKKFANAVYRNKHKRQVRHALDIINRWDMKYDLVIILRKSFLNLSFERKVKELKKMFERL